MSVHEKLCPSISCFCIDLHSYVSFLSFTKVTTSKKTTTIPHICTIVRLLNVTFIPFVVECVLKMHIDVLLLSNKPTIS